MIRKHLLTMFKFEGEQDFRTLKRNEWREYAYNKWSKEVNTKTI